MFLQMIDTNSYEKKETATVYKSVKHSTLPQETGAYMSNEVKIQELHVNFSKLECKVHFIDTTTTKCVSL